MPKEPCEHKFGLKQVVWLVGLCSVLSGAMVSIGRYCQKVDDNTSVTKINVPQLEKDMTATRSEVVHIKAQNDYMIGKVDEISVAVGVLASRHEGEKVCDRDKPASKTDTKLR